MIAQESAAHSSPSGAVPSRAWPGRGRRHRVRWIGLGIVVATIIGTPALSATAQSAPTSRFFFDGFDGGSISTKWDTSIATSGVRWCSPTGELLGEGQWLDDSGETTCNGAHSYPPHGVVTVGGGRADFQATTDGFAYIFRGPPSKASPFPAKGDFTLTISMQYSVQAPNGAGIEVLAWPSTNPSGWNPPDTGQVFQVWGAGVPQTGLTTQLGRQIKGGVPDTNAIHVYRLVYAAGSYSVFLDGQLWQGPLESPVRPNAIWIGNPDERPNGQDVSSWCRFAIDYVSVTSP
jgi:hypothetical protein